MRKIRAAVLAGAAALAAAGTAVAASHDSHVLKVGLPDGSVARIEYQGDIAPRITVTPEPRAAAVWLDPFEAAPFALLDRIAAEMDRQTDMMMRQARALPLLTTAEDGKLDLAAFGSLPPGTVSYSFVSTSNGPSTCSRSVQVTSLGPGRPPKVVSNSSGDCRAAPLGPVAHPGRTNKDATT